MAKNAEQSPLERSSLASFDQKLAMAKRCSHVSGAKAAVVAGAQSPLERSRPASFDHRLAMAKRCSHEGVVAGAKAAVVATIATAIPTMAIARMLPWARANLNYTAQALIISTVAGAAYFIVADKTILESARRNSFNQPGAGASQLPN